MGSLMVREGGGMSTVAKVAVGVVACYAALHVLPLILGASFLAGIVGLAVVGMAFSALMWVLNAAVWVGVPVLVILFILGMLKDDD